MDELLKKIAEKHDIDVNLLQELIKEEATRVHLERRRNVGNVLRRVIENWIEKQK